MLNVVILGVVMLNVVALLGGAIKEHCKNSFVMPNHKCL
jgi:hypothetical protein